MTAPRLIVEARWGRLAGTKLVLRPGQSARVGRTSGADLVVEHDGRMSREHFDLAWDGEKALLKDLGSVTGTMLEGKAIEGETAVRHGGWVQAGDTHFMVYVEGRTPAPDEEIDPEGVEAALTERQRREAAARALAELRGLAAREPLYALLDAARDDRILELIREHVEPHRSLYEGLDGEALEEVAPYLAGPMRADSGLLERLVLEGWGKRWGMWCTSEETFVEVRRHWRRFLMVELEESGERVYFRFYDPGVMRVFWDSCEEGQKAAFFGRAWSWLFERNDGDIAHVRSSADVHP